MEQKHFLLFLGCCKHAGWGDAAVVYALYGRMIIGSPWLSSTFLLKVNWKKGNMQEYSIYWEKGDQM